MEGIEKPVSEIENESVEETKPESMEETKPESMEETKKFLLVEGGDVLNDEDKVISEKKTFELPISCIKRSKILSQCDELFNDGKIDFPDVPSDCLEVIVDYLITFKDEPMPSSEEDEIEKRNADFTDIQKKFIEKHFGNDENLNRCFIIKVLNSAEDALQIECLGDLLAKKTALSIADKTNEETRILYGIMEEFSKEYEEDTKREFPWADPEKNDDDEE